MKTTVIFKNPRGYLESTRYLNVASIFLDDEKKYRACHALNYLRERSRNGDLFAKGTRAN